MKKVLSLFLLVTIIMSTFTFTAFASEEIIITTSDSLCKLDGSEWNESTNPVVEGPTGGTSWYSASKTDKAIYDASGLKGEYGVYVYITPYGATANMVDFTITASGKATTLVTDGYEGGSENRHWKFLGIYDFNGSAGDSIVQQMNSAASSTGTTTSGNGNIRASGVKFIKNDTNTEKVTTVDVSKIPDAPVTTDKKPSSESDDGIVITTSDPECVRKGTWNESTSEAVAGPLGGTSWYTTEKTATVFYDASGLEKGNYGVYLYMTPLYTTADKVDVTITASGEDTTFVTDGMHGGGGNRHWIFLGKYDFTGEDGEGVTQQINKNAGVVGGTSSAGSMRASGVKFVKDDKNTAAIDSLGEATTGKAEPDAPKEIVYSTVPETGSITIGTNHAGFEKHGTWVDSSLIMPADGLGWYTATAGDTGMWHPYINKAENVEVFYFKPNATNTEEPALKVEVFAEGETTTHTIDFTQPPTDWYSLGRYNFSGDGSEYIKVTSSGVGTARITCLKFAINDDAKKDDVTNSAFFGTDLHILERMGMLIGEGDGITEEYLKKVPTRVQAAVMILRLNGVDKEAEAFTGTDNFADSDQEPWALPYLAYLKAHPELGLIGTGDNMFQPTANIDAQAYAKILLTALGYEYNVDFTWDGTLAFAKEKGIAVAENAEFTVNDLAVMTESILDLNCKDGTSYFKKLILERDNVKNDVWGTELTPELKAARDAAKNKKRGIIYNNDGNDVYVSYPNYPGAYDISHLDGTTINAENFLKARSYGLEETQVGTVVYCTGVFGSYHHESVGVTDTRVRCWARALKEYTGKDSLTTMVDYVHSIGKDIIWSLRMNDVHDSSYEENELDPWKQANLDALMYRKAENSYMSYGGGFWSAVDYTLPKVRQFVYDNFLDTLTRYDIDGIELDMTRWPIFFKEVTLGYDVYPENLERMTNLVRTLRDLTEKISIERGKPILLTIYVPDSIGFCKTVGIDIETWLKEDLVDIVAIGWATGHFQEWEDSVGEYKDNYDIPVYVALDPLGMDGMTTTYEADRNEVALAYEAGADGIYTYNYFDPNDKLFDTFGSPETAGPVDPNYVTKRTIFKSRYSKDGLKYVTLTK